MLEKRGPFTRGLIIQALNPLQSHTRLLSFGSSLCADYQTRDRDTPAGGISDSVYIIAGIGPELVV